MKKTRIITTIGLASSLAVALFVMIAPSQALAWNLQGSCAGAPSTIQTGGSVTWTATQTSTMKPSEGHYEWTWSGTNSLSGTTQSVPKTYTTAGTKTANVVIKLVLNSGWTEQITRSCTVVVQDPPKECILHITKSVDKATASVGDTLTYTINVENTGTGDCTGGGVKIKDIVDPRLDFLSETHTSNISAGYGSFPLYSAASRTLYWNGNTLIPGESGSITWRGTVNAPASCGSFVVPNKASITSYEYNNFNTWVESNTVTTNVDYACIPELVGSCTATPTSALVGDTVNFSSTASGGTGTYTYVWTGTDGLSDTNASVSKSYATAGTKDAQVVITSGAQSKTAQCSVTITEPPPSPATLTIIKHVINDNGGIKTAADFNVWVKQGASHVIGSPAIGSETGTTFTLAAGNYVVGEDDPSGLGYSLDGISGNCASSGAITLVAGDNKTCTVTNNDNPLPPSLAISCAGTPSSLVIGDSATFTATASGGTGTYTYVWTGTDGLSDTNASVSKSYATAGTKNAEVTVTSGTETNTAQCSVVVTSPPGPTPFSAVCSVSPASIRLGESATWSATASGGTGTYTYVWTGTDGLSDTTQNVTKTYSDIGTKSGTVEVASGSQTVIATCSLNVLPPPGGCTSNCGGGGFNQPNVVLLKKPPEGRVLSAVYLSQVPYTGIGDWYKIPLFLIILAVWSASVVYFLRSKLWRKKKEIGSLQTASSSEDIHENIFEIHGEEVSQGDWTPGSVTYQDNTQHMNTHTVSHSGFSGLKTYSVPQSSSGVIEVIAAEAQRNHVVISEEGMQYVAGKSNNNATEAVSLVRQIIQNGEALYARDEGWLLLNKEKVVASLAPRVKSNNFVPVHEVSVANQVVSKSPSNGTVAMPVVEQRTVANGNGQSSQIDSHAQVDSTTFISWLVSGDKPRVAQHLKNLRAQQGAVEAFLKKVVLGLDAVHRSRVEEIDEKVDERLAHSVSGLSNQGLEELISALLSMFDQNYQSSTLNVKLALMRASEAGKEK